MVAQENTENNSAQETTTPPAETKKVTLHDLYITAFNAATEDDANGLIYAMLAIASEIRYLRLVLEVQRDDAN